MKVLKVGFGSLTRAFIDDSGNDASVHDSWMTGQIATNVVERYRDSCFNRRQSDRRSRETFWMRQMGICEIRRRLLGAHFEDIAMLLDVLEARFEFFDRGASIQDLLQLLLRICHGCDLRGKCVESIMER